MTEYWSEKSDKETVQKQIDLDALKNARTKDLDKYQNLARTVSSLFSFYLWSQLSLNTIIPIKKYTEYEQVVVEYRLEKDRERRQAEQEKLELEASIRVLKSSKYLKISIW